MICRNHVDVSEGVRRCARCGATFCRDCLVDIGGHPYCATCKTEQLLDVRSGVQRGVLDLASIGRRLVAYIIDSFLLNIVSTVLGFFLGLTMGGNPDTAATLTLLSVLLSVGAITILSGLLLAATYREEAPSNALQGTRRAHELLPPL